MPKDEPAMYLPAGKAFKGHPHALKIVFDGCRPVFVLGFKRGDFSVEIGLDQLLKTQIGLSLVLTSGDGVHIMAADTTGLDFDREQEQRGKYFLFGSVGIVPFHKSERHEE